MPARPGPRGQARRRAVLEDGAGSHLLVLGFLWGRPGSGRPLLGVVGGGGVASRLGGCGQDGGHGCQAGGRPAARQGEAALQDKLHHGLADWSVGRNTGGQSQGRRQAGAINLGENSRLSGASMRTAPSPLSRRTDLGQRGRAEASAHVQGHRLLAARHPPEQGPQGESWALDACKQEGARGRVPAGSPPQGPRLRAPRPLPGAAGACEVGSLRANIGEVGVPWPPRTEGYFPAGKLKRSPSSKDTGWLQPPPIPRAPTLPQPTRACRRTPTHAGPCPQPERRRPPPAGSR